MKENNIDEIATGYPVNMDRSMGNKAKQVDRFIKILSSKLPTGTKINHIDERLTSEQAISEQRSFHGKQSPTKTRKQRNLGIVDSIAATIILQDFLRELELRGEKR
jgi:putative Holliday junction resolvase